jgi:2-haloacid dehalogenase
MSLVSRLSPRPHVVAFDAYGTLFDVHSAVGRHVTRIGPQAAALSAIWRAKQLEYSWVLSLAGRYRDFEALTREALSHALALFPGVDAGLADDLMASYRQLSAYPDAGPVLARLKAQGCKTCILSNGSPAMLMEATRSAGLETALDAVLSVDAVKVFKTAPVTYRLVTQRFNTLPGEVLFISSNRWDVAGAASFGFQPVWINRSGQPGEYADLSPVAMLSSLDELG